MSTQASTNSLRKEGVDDDEDKSIEEFAKNLEQISKQPLPKIAFSGGQRRRRKLKPNISKEWVNKLRKQLKSQQNSD